MDGQKDGWMDGCRDGQKDGRMDGGMDDDVHFWKPVPPFFSRLWFRYLSVASSGLYHIITLTFGPLRCKYLTDLPVHLKGQTITLSPADTKTDGLMNEGKDGCEDDELVNRQD